MQDNMLMTTKEPSIALCVPFFSHFTSFPDFFGLISVSTNPNKNGVSKHSANDQFLPILRSEPISFATIIPITTCAITAIKIKVIFFYFYPYVPSGWLWYKKSAWDIPQSVVEVPRSTHYTEYAKAHALT